MGSRVESSLIEIKKLDVTKSTIACGRNFHLYRDASTIKCKRRDPILLPGKQQKMTSVQM